MNDNISLYNDFNVHVAISLNAFLTTTGCVITLSIQFVHQKCKPLKYKNANTSSKQHFKVTMAVLSAALKWCLLVNKLQ